MKRKPIYMIHKHQATHLHYDLRLEIDGVLKSWALRKLPLKPNDPVLAILVSDHPFWYRHFEGVIPEGRYGAGPVMVWDKGLYNSFFFDNYKQRLTPHESFANGVLLIWIEGRKLEGMYALIRISKKQKWLLLNVQGIHANKIKQNHIGWQRSVKSDKTLNQILKHRPRRKKQTKENLKK